MGNFADNHDLNRFLTDQPNGDVQLFKNALAWVLLADGIPVIYYGTEAGLKGVEQGGSNRPCLWETGYDRSSELYQSIARLAR